MRTQASSRCRHRCHEPNGSHSIAASQRAAAALLKLLILNMPFAYDYELFPRLWQEFQHACSLNRKRLPAMMLCVLTCAVWCSCTVLIEVLAMTQLFGWQPKGLAAKKDVNQWQGARFWCCSAFSVQRFAAKPAVMSRECKSSAAPSRLSFEDARNAWCQGSISAPLAPQASTRGCSNSHAEVCRPRHALRPVRLPHTWSLASRFCVAWPSRAAASVLQGVWWPWVG